MSNVATHRLANGYTEFWIDASPQIPLPAVSDTCVTCGKPVGADTAGSRQSYVGSGGIPGHPVRFSAEVYLCQSCASEGFRISDFIALGLEGNKYTVRIGNEVIAQKWRAALDQYCRVLQEGLRAAIRQSHPEVRDPEVGSIRVHEERVPAEDVHRRPPLRMAAASSGCATAVIMLGLAAAGVAVFLRWAVGAP